MPLIWCMQPSIHVPLPDARQELVGSCSASQLQLRAICGMLCRFSKAVTPPAHLRASAPVYPHMSLRITL